MKLHVLGVWFTIQCTAVPTITKNNSELVFSWQVERGGEDPPGKRGAVHKDVFLFITCSQTDWLEGQYSFTSTAAIIRPISSCSWLTFSCGLSSSTLNRPDSVSEKIFESSFEASFMKEIFIWEESAFKSLQHLLNSDQNFQSKKEKESCVWSSF